jgi:hypothetical protein
MIASPSNALVMIVVDEALLERGNSRFFDDHPKFAGTPERSMKGYCFLAVLHRPDSKM